MKKNLFLAILCVLGLFGTLNAQVVTIDGTVGGYTTESGNKAPVYCANKWAITQQFYTAEEIGKSSGTIETIAFKTTDQGTYPYTRNLNVYMVNSDEYAIVGNGMKAMSASDLVFSGEVTFAQNAWVSIDITDFEYTGKNILICVNDVTGSNVSGGAYFEAFKCSVTIDGNNANRVLWKRSTSAAFDATTAVTGATVGAPVPFVQFTFAAGTTEEYADPSNPTNFVATPASESKIQLTWEAAAETESYNIYEGTELVANVEGTSYAVKNLALGEHCYTIKGANGPKESTGVEACATLVAKKVKSITVGTTGEGDSQTAPISLYTQNSWVEQIYTATEIGQACTIERISFATKPANQYSTPFTTKEIKIYLAETTKFDYADKSWTAEDELVLVYSDTDIIIGDQEWETFEFETPFNYGGVKNLAVVVAKSADETSAQYFWHTNSVANGVLYAETSAYPTEQGNVTTTRPVVKFAWESEDGDDNEGDDNEGNEGDGNEGDDNEGGDVTPEIGYYPTTFLFDFENGNLNGLNVIDANNDGVKWQFKNGYDGGVNDGKGVYSGMPGYEKANDYLVTASKYSMTTTSEFTFTFVPLDYTFFKEKIAVVVSEDGENFENIWSYEYEEYDGQWKEASVNLSEYAGKDLYVGLHHYGSEDGIRVDNIKLYSQEPSVPANFKATATETTITLTWDAVSNATSYNVYAVAGEDYTLLENVTATTYTIEGLELATDYSYTVTSVNEFKESKYANVITVSTALPEGVELLLKETFESYEVDQYIAKDGAEHWTTWSKKPGTAEDGKIVDLNGNKVGYLTYGNDQILKLGGYQAGVFELEFDIYVPEGKAGYYNILHQYEGNTAWALQAYLQMTDDGNGNSKIADGHGSVHAGIAEVADIPCVYDEWMHFRVAINANIDKAEYYYTIGGNEEVKAFEWQWSKDCFGESVVGRKLDAMNFFPPTSSSEYYIDNLMLKRIGGESAPIISFDNESVDASMDKDDLRTIELEIENIGTSIAEYVAWIDYGKGAMSGNDNLVSYSAEDISESTSIGWDISSPLTFEIAALYPSSAYAGSVMGAYISQAAYYLGQFVDPNGSTVPMLEPGTDMIFRIYGQGINGKPGAILAEKTVPAENIVLDWNIVKFDEPVALTGFDFYLAVEMTQCVGGAPIVFDGKASNQMIGYADLCRQSSSAAFKSLTEFTGGATYGNLNLMVYCVGDAVKGGWAELSKKDGELEVGAKETIEIEFTSFGLKKGEKYEAKLVLQTNTEEGMLELPISLYVWGENVDEILSNTYNIYPNPTSAQVTVEGENINYIAVYNSVGQLVKVVRTQNNVVDMSANESGVYFFNIVDNAGQSSVQRVVVAK